MDADADADAGCCRWFVVARDDDDDDDDDDGKGDKGSKESQKTYHYSYGDDDGNYSGKGSESSQNSKHNDESSSSDDRQTNYQEHDHKEHSDNGRTIIKDEGRSIITDTRPGSQDKNDNIDENETIMVDTTPSQEQTLDDTDENETIIVNTTISQEQSLGDIDESESIVANTAISQEQNLDDTDESKNIIANTTTSQEQNLDVTDESESIVADTAISQEQNLNDKDESESIVADATLSQKQNLTPDQDDVGGTAENVRTVQLSHPDALGECMAFDYSVNTTVLYMSECSTTKNNLKQNDYWEIPQARISTEDSEGEKSTFHLRHKATQLCIPVNPETPNRPFDCHRYFGMDEAIADSFNGLVDCDSGFPAVFGMNGDSNSLYLKNSGCSSEMNKQYDDGSDMEVVFITYHHPVEDKRVVVWGEKILLELEDVVADYEFRTEWAFMDVVEVDGRNSFLVPHSDSYENLFDLTSGENAASP